MIDPTRDLIQGTFFIRKIRVEKLKKLLEKLENNDELFPNMNGDLAILREDREIGFINLNEEEIELL